MLKHHPRLRWVLILGVSFAVGYFMPEWLFIPTLCVAAPFLIWQLSDVSQARGYWKAQIEFAAILQQAAADTDRTAEEVLDEIVRGIAFQALVAPGLKRSWWRRVLSRG